MLSVSLMTICILNGLIVNIPYTIPLHFGYNVQVQVLICNLGLRPEIHIHTIQVIHTKELCFTFIFIL